MFVCVSASLTDVLTECTVKHIDMLANLICHAQVKSVCAVCVCVCGRVPHWEKHSIRDGRAHHICDCLCQGRGVHKTQLLNTNHCSDRVRETCVVSTMHRDRERNVEDGRMFWWKHFREVC